jgi:hypothetical protein
MSLEFDATYRDGALYPAAPLSLPDNTPVRVTVAVTPQHPAMTLELFDTLVQKHRFSAPPLPADFSRADIYIDRD